MADKSTKNQVSSHKAINLRIDVESLAWVDQEALRQRRSRAFVIAQAVRLAKAVVEQMERERASLSLE